MPKYTTDDNDQPELIAEPRAEYNVTPEAQAEKEAYRKRLAALLKDPEFRKTEGFPLGTDEAILALSDPPYYTACPNPFLGEIVERWREERRALRKAKDLPDDESQLPLTHIRQPFASDVSEGKNDPIYNAHSYHTKVPHKAIMRYILHYTDPGDIVLDGFCGTGMTGVAAQLCGDKKTVESLGYTVKDGNVFEAEDGGEKNEDGGKKTEAQSPSTVRRPISKLGARKAVLVDLSPAATFIAYNYNTPVDARAFEREAKRVLKEVEKECGWMYETRHTDDSLGKINYTVWSEVFSCPHCGAELVYYDLAVNKETFEVVDKYPCLKCATLLLKKSLDRVWLAEFDETLGRPHKLVRYVPVLINYQVDKKRYEKNPDTDDLALIQKIQATPIPDWFPVHEMPDGERKGKDGYHLKGITHLHHFYFRRALMVYARIWQKVKPETNLNSRAFLDFFVQGSCLGFTKMNRYQAIQFGRSGGSQVNRYFSGTLFVGSLISEVSPSYSMTHKLGRLIKLSMPGQHGGSAVSCQSTTKASIIPNNSIDYVFVDPPFGNNLHYSELNFFWEAWLKILTERIPEAVMDKARQRTLYEYQELMVSAFCEMYRVLKPGHWITVEFHNSQNAVWNAIQESMQHAGFVVADVSTLDKQQETYKQSIQKLVKQDLIISAYKPTAAFEQKFREQGGSIQGAWDFARQHLENLPLPTLKDSVIEPVQERMPYLLYDRMVAFHIQRGLNVPLSAPEFYQGLTQRFLEREGMIFTPAQAAAYDKLRLQAERVAQLALFVTDESSARQWIRQEIDPASGHGPQTYSDLMPRFVQQLHKSKFEALPELKVLLEQSFLEDEAGCWYNADPEKQADLEALRQKALLREFSDYRRSKGRLKVFRSEAIRAGFSQAWRERQYEVIVEIAERMPESVLQEDQKLLMYYHNASLRQSEKPNQPPLI